MWESGGPRRVAKMIDSESPRIRAWLRREAAPKAVIMQELVKLGNGAFDYDDIINETKGTVRERKLGQVGGRNERHT